jgi:hypothetical protein
MEEIMRQFVDFTVAGIAITDEPHLSPAGQFTLNHDCWKDLEIWTGPGKTGTMLTQGTDYAIDAEQTITTSTGASAPVHTSLIIVNADYAGLTLYYHYNAIADFVSSRVVYLGSAGLPAYYHADGPFIRKDTDANVIQTPGNVAFNIGIRGFVMDKSIDLDITDDDNWDSTYTSDANQRYGRDFYVYACYPDRGDIPRLVFSYNATYPTLPGIDGESSRKLAGGHYGAIRKVVPNNRLWIPAGTDGLPFGTGWEQNVTQGIVPNSVWDLGNRPKCSPEGMVKVGSIWVDIYQSSAAEQITFQGTGLHVSGGRLQSKYGQLPVTGTEGLNWYEFAELAEMAGKRMLTYSEWIQAARGNPQGEATETNYGWTKTNNNSRTRTGCSVNGGTGAYDPAAGIKRYALSAYNVVDTVGNVWEWIDELSNRHDTTSWAWKDVLGSGMGQAYLPNDTGLSAFIVGGDWSDGVYCGPRAVALGDYPWDRNVHIGVRLACDAA